MNCKKTKVLQKSLLAKQDLAHKSSIENPLIYYFYVIIVIFLGLLFQLTQKSSKIKRKKKISSVLISTIFYFSMPSTLFDYVILNLAHSF